MKDTKVIQEVATFLSGAALVLMDSICRCHSKEEKQKLGNEERKSIIEEQSESMKLLLSYLIEWLMLSDPSAQSLRINLYSTLVRFLRLIHINSTKKDVVEIDSSMYISRLDGSSTVRTANNIKALYIPDDVFSTYNEKLIELISIDCINGHDASKILAMSVFNLLISITGNIRWIIYMSGRGYLKYIIEGLLNSDNYLKDTLKQSSSNVRPLYTFAAKINLLSQFASTKIGAELVLEHALLSCLSSMKVFDSHPEILKQSQATVEGIEDGTSFESKYMQIYLPTLDLCNTIITTLGSKNKSAVVQVINFLISHLDVVEIILRSGSPALASPFLEELNLLTSVIAR